MAGLDRTAVRADLLKILSELRDDWEYSQEITERTGLFTDLEFESIDAVALGAAVEDHFSESLPFAEFLTKAQERGAKDIFVGELVDFLMTHLRLSTERRT